MTPDLYSQVFFGLSAGWWVLERKHTGYFNMAVDAGCLYGLDGAWLIALRLSPVVLGGPQYRTAERVLAVGQLFDPQRLRLLFQFQLIAITLYLQRPARTPRPWHRGPAESDLAPGQDGGPLVPGRAVAAIDQDRKRLGPGGQSAKVFDSPEGTRPHGPP